MIITSNRNKKPSITSEGQISITQNDSDSITTLKLSQQKNYLKIKEKNQLMLTEAALRQLLHADRFISSEKSYFKFPQFDFFLNIDCLFSSINTSGPVEGSVISVINQFKKVKYTEISKKSNGVHIFFQKKDCFQMPWQCIVDRMQSLGNQNTYEMSNYLMNICQKEYILKEDSESLNDQSFDQLSAQKIFNDCPQREVIDKIDELFLQNKNKPMVIWRGAQKEMHSFHINECYLNFLQYTPEEFQLEVALSGIPEFLTSHNYYEWVKQLLSVVNNALSLDKHENHARQCYTFLKEHITQYGQHLSLELESYDLIVGGCNLVIEVGVNEIKQTKKKNKKKSDATNAATNNESKEEQQQKQKGISLMNLCEAKRKLTDEEKYFINNHYFKIQDFDFNKSKVCKYRVLQSDFSTKVQLQFHA